VSWKFKGCEICGAPGAHKKKDCPAYRVNEMQEATSTPQKVMDAVVRRLIEPVVAAEDAAAKLKRAWNC
jgi:hypothetical protein